MFHTVRWNQENIKHFWDFLSSRQVRDDTYFSWNVGAGLVRYVSGLIPLRTPLVDVGCGPGFLLDQFLLRGLACRGVDLSPESVAALTTRIGQNPQFLGANVGGATGTGLQDNEAGTLFLVEVLEHLLPEDLGAALDEMRRVLVPGGHLVVTVPNDEELERSELACPECGCVFHKWQHVGSFSSRTLPALLAAHGLIPVSVEEVDLGLWRFGPLRRMRAQWIARRQGSKPPHLVVIARKGCTGEACP